MRIALLTDGIYPYVLGGMQKHSFYLARYLAQREVFVDLYHCVAFNEFLPEELMEFTVQELQYINHFAIHFPKPSVYPGHYLVESYQYSKQLYNLILNQSKPNLIYTQGFTGWYLLKHRNKLGNIPIFVNFHGLNMFQQNLSLKSKIEALFFRLTVKSIIKIADYNISLGGRLTEILNANGAQDIIDLPIGIENNWIIKSKLNKIGIIKFCFIGRYEKLKGINELNRSLSKIMNEPFEFHFIGPIEPNQQITDSRVIYHGAIRKQEKVKTLLEQMDVLVVPSWSEGMPTVILEAMACGCAILATNVGAVSVQVDEQNGWMVEPGNVQQLTNQLKAILQMSRQMLIEKQQKSLEKIKAFTWEKIIDDHILAFEATIQKSQSSPYYREL